MRLWVGEPSRHEGLSAVVCYSLTINSSRPDLCLDVDFYVVVFSCCRAAQNQALTTQFHSVGERPLLVSISPLVELNISSEFNTSCG